MHKNKKHPQIWCTMVLTTKLCKSPKRGCSMNNSIHHSNTIYNLFKKLNLGNFMSDIYLDHTMSITLSVFKHGYSGKTIDFAACSDKHRTTESYFLCKGKWNDPQLKKVLKDSVIEVVYHEAAVSGKPVFCIVDDTIASHTKPSSKALHPIENAYFHMSHLKGCQDYGHQAVAVILACNGIVLNYTIEMYDKTQSKIEIIKNIAKELPQPPTISYFLCDSWYSSEKLCNEFIKKGFYTIGALKTNRIIYPCGIRQQACHFAKYIRKADTNLVTVGNREFYVYRYDGNLPKIENAVVLLCYPKNAFGQEKALRVFMCTNTDLSTIEILRFYAERWNIEVFFRQSKNILAFDKYQIRSSKGICRYWLIMSLIHFICCSIAEDHSFSNGFKIISNAVEREFLLYLYNCGKNLVPLEVLYSLVG